MYNDLVLHPMLPNTNSLNEYLISSKTSPAERVHINIKVCLLDRWFIEDLQQQQQQQKY